MTIAHAVINQALSVIFVTRTVTATCCCARRYQPLHEKLLTHPKQVLSTLLAYVCYPESIPIQVEAIRLALELSARIPDLPLRLQRPPGFITAPLALPGHGLGGLSSVAANRAAGMAYLESLAKMTEEQEARDGGSLGELRRGYAAAMRGGLLSGDAVDHLDAWLESDDAVLGQQDPRAALVMRLLLQNCDKPDAPNFTHALMGYVTSEGLAGVSSGALMPRNEFSCLSALERLLERHT